MLESSGTSSEAVLEEKCGSGLCFPLDLVEAEGSTILTEFPLLTAPACLRDVCIVGPMDGPGLSMFVRAGRGSAMLGSVISLISDKGRKILDESLIGVVGCAQVC